MSAYEMLTLVLFLIMAIVGFVGLPIMWCVLMLDFIRWRSWGIITMMSFLGLVWVWCVWGIVGGLLGWSL